MQVIQAWKNFIIFHLWHSSPPPFSSVACSWTYVQLHKKLLLGRIWRTLTYLAVCLYFFRSKVRFQEDVEFSFCVTLEVFPLVSYFLRWSCCHTDGVYRLRDFFPNLVFFCICYTVGKCTLKNVHIFFKLCSWVYFFPYSIILWTQWTNSFCPLLFLFFYTAHWGGRNNSGSYHPCGTEPFHRRDTFHIHTLFLLHVSNVPE